MGTIKTARVTERNDKQAIFKNCTLFTDCISQISSTERDSREGIDIVRLMSNLIEYSNK